jgi:phenylacetate-coenzyme A ligase PaaK-like adenylate-forming protein
MTLVFATAVRQMSFAWSMLSGREFRVTDLAGLVDDLQATLEEFGTPGEGAGEMFSAPDPQMQRDLTMRRLRRTIRSAARDVPYYRAWFDANGVDAATVTLDSLAVVEPTPKAALRGLPAAFVSDRARPALAATTTGTTGTPTLVWFSRYDLEVISTLNAFSLMLIGGLRANHVWANCISSRSMAQILMERSVPMTGAAFLPVGVVDPCDALDRLAMPLRIPGKETKVTHLNATASYLGLLVQEAERQGRNARDFGLKEIRSGGEVLTDALRARAEETLGGLVVDGYSMTEIVPVAGQVCSQGHLHIPSDQGHVEVLDPVSHLPAAPGTVGVLTVTPYLVYRNTTMLLRYLTGDLVRVLETKGLDCEMAGIPATSRILGRMTAGAVTTRDLLDLLQAERALPLPSRYALDETARGSVLHVVAGRVSRSLLARLEERAAALALPLHGIVLVGDAAELPRPCPVRADLRETSFEPRGVERAFGHTVPQG